SNAWTQPTVPPPCDEGPLPNAAALYDPSSDQIARTRIVTKGTDKQARKLIEVIEKGGRSKNRIVDALVERGVVADAAEIPQLPLETIMEVDLEKEIGAKTADRIIRNLERSREVPFDHVLFALGIRFVGETTARYLAAHFGSLDALMAASR